MHNISAVPLATAADQIENSNVSSNMKKRGAKKEKYRRSAKKKHQRAIIKILKKENKSIKEQSKAGVGGIIGVKSESSIKGINIDKKKKKKNKSKASIERIGGRNHRRRNHQRRK